MSIWNFLFGLPQPDPVPADGVVRSDADAPPYDEADPEVQAFYRRDAYEAIRADARRKRAAPKESA